jgi:hypothetical protein
MLYLILLFVSKIIHCFNLNLCSYGHKLILHLVNNLQMQNVINLHMTCDSWTFNNYGWKRIELYWSVCLLFFFYSWAILYYVQEILIIWRIHNFFTHYLLLPENTGNEWKFLSFQLSSLTSLDHDVVVICLLCNVKHYPF